VLAGWHDALRVIDGSFSAPALALGLVTQCVSLCQIVIAFGSPRTGSANWARTRKRDKTCGRMRNTWLVGWLVGWLDFCEVVSLCDRLVCVVFGWFRGFILSIVTLCFIVRLFSRVWLSLFCFAMVS